MGVKTTITLQEAQRLFPAFRLENLQATDDGVMDTTYLLDNYILKRYERDILQKIDSDAYHLQTLHKAGLNVPTLLAQNKEWYLYKRLNGLLPKNIQLFHIQTLAQFMAKMHKVTQKMSGTSNFLENYSITTILMPIKKEYYFYYKKLSSLKNFTMRNDGFIHGDIFVDNTLFYNRKIAVFDFIDGGSGSFTFDIAVALLSFNPHKRRLYTNIFLNTYNQHAPKKIKLSALELEVTNAAKLYGLLRLDSSKNVKKAKLLEKFW